jgi:hypothetical protein
MALLSTVGLYLRLKTSRHHTVAICWHAPSSSSELAAGVQHNHVHVYSSMLGAVAFQLVLGIL